MKRTVLVNIQCIQQFEDHTEQIKSQSTGTHLLVGDTHCIVYTEKLEGNIIVSNTLTLKDKKACLSRKGDITSNMKFELGKTTNFVYQSNYGNIPFQIETLKYKRDVHEGHVNVMLLYHLKMNRQRVSLNTLSINVQFMEK